MSRFVDCVVLKKNAEGLEQVPHPGELGIRIYENVSQEAWKSWLNQATIIINENALNTGDVECIALLEEYMRAFFFQEGKYAQ